MTFTFTSLSRRCVGPIPLRPRLARVALGAIFLASAGCTGSSTAGGDTTCEEWIALDDQLEIEEALADPDGMSDEARAVLDDAMREASLDDNELNVQFARTNLLEFCGPDGTGMRPNLDEPISGAFE